MIRIISYPFGVEHFEKKFDGEYLELSKLGLIQEMKWFMQNLELENTVFRSDHASNYLVLKGNLNRDKEMLMGRINEVLEDPKNAGLREEWMRGL